MGKTLFILNVHSGTGLSGKLHEQVQQCIDREDLDAEIINLDKPGDFAGIGEKIRQTRPEKVIVGGGDGTINAVAMVLKNKDIPMGILPLGSANGFAYELGIPDDTREALDLAIQGEVRKVDLLVIDDEHISLHMCDLGMNARVIKRRESEGVKGFFGYAYQYFKELFNEKRFAITVRSGEEVIRMKTIMVIIANASFFGTGAEFSPESRIDDGVFEIVVVQAYPTWYLFHLFLSIFRKNNRENNLSRTFRFREAVLEATPPEELQVDGEPVGKRNRVSVSIMPGAIQVIC